MTFTVTGAVYGDPYAVTWEDGGLLTGDTRVIGLLRDSVGQQVVVPATGPVYTLDLSDGQSVLAALLDLTSVADAEGDVPQVVPDGDEPAGTVY